MTKYWFTIRFRESSHPHRPGHRRWSRHGVNFRVCLGRVTITGSQYGA